MVVFPQLSTGTVALYPVKRTRRVRTVQNSLPGGNAVKYADVDVAVTQWDLEAIGMSEAERAALAGFFETVAGQEKTFTFIEPAGNLLTQSETFGADGWDNSPLMTVVTAIDDPWGGTRGSRITNGGPVAGSIMQVLAVPGEYQYVLSVWARASTASEVTLFAETAGGNAELVFPATGTWRRIVMPVTLGLATEFVQFGVRIQAAKVVDLVGMQVEAQPGAGDYQRTGAMGGVHAKARFGMDELLVRSRGTDVFDAVIRIVSKGN